MQLANWCKQTEHWDTKKVQQRFFLFHPSIHFFSSLNNCPVCRLQVAGSSPTRTQGEVDPGSSSPQGVAARQQCYCGAVGCVCHPDQCMLGHTQATSSLLPSPVHSLTFTHISHTGAPMVSISLLLSSLLKGIYADVFLHKWGKLFFTNSSFSLKH